MQYGMEVNFDVMISWENRCGKRSIFRMRSADHPINVNFNPKPGYTLLLSLQMFYNRTYKNNQNKIRTI
jgi:hypothetical protein